MPWDELLQLGLALAHAALEADGPRDPLSDRHEARWTSQAYMHDVGRPGARGAPARVARADTATKNRALLAIAARDPPRRARRLLAANAEDVAPARAPTGSTPRCSTA